MDAHKQKVMEEELAVRRAETSIRRALVKLDSSTYTILKENWNNRELQ